MSTNQTRERSIFIFTSMALAIGLLALFAWKFPGWISASIWSYGFSLVYLLYVLIKKDYVLGRFLLFSLFAGFTELLPDGWLVSYTNTLFYPEGQPMLYHSPMYMPFSWVVVLTQIGYIGYLINKKHNLLVTSIIIGLLGSSIIPFYEYLAIHAEWWHYENAPKWGIVPIYIFVAEGLLMLTIPDLFDRCERLHIKFIPLFGILQGLVMWVACLIAWFLIG